jgi:hypothetical protein
MIRKAIDLVRTKTKTTGRVDRYLQGDTRELVESSDRVKSRILNIRFDESKRELIQTLNREVEACRSSELVQPISILFKLDKS